MKKRDDKIINKSYHFLRPSYQKLKRNDNGCSPCRSFFLFSNNLSIEIGKYFQQLFQVYDVHLKGLGSANNLLQQLLQRWLKKPGSVDYSDQQLLQLWLKVRGCTSTTLSSLGFTLEEPGNIR
ncbi:unnamed protein product [Mucor hiemalis]